MDRSAPILGRAPGSVPDGIPRVQDRGHESVPWRGGIARLLDDCDAAGLRDAREVEEVAALAVSSGDRNDGVDVVEGGGPAKHDDGVGGHVCREGCAAAGRRDTRWTLLVHTT